MNQIKSNQSNNYSNNCLKNQQQQQPMIYSNGGTSEVTIHSQNQELELEDSPFKSKHRVQLSFERTISSNNLPKDPFDDFKPSELTTPSRATLKKLKLYQTHQPHPSADSNLPTLSHDTSPTLSCSSTDSRHNPPTTTTTTTNPQELPANFYKDPTHHQNHEATNLTSNLTSASPPPPQFTSSSPATTTAASSSLDHKPPSLDRKPSSRRSHLRRPQRPTHHSEDDVSHCKCLIL